VSGEIPGPGTSPDGFEAGCAVCTHFSMTEVHLLVTKRDDGVAIGAFVITTEGTTNSKCTSME
jgi:hypothetical protein